MVSYSKRENLVVCIVILCPSQQYFSHAGMEPLLNWHLTVLWEVKENVLSEFLS